EPEQPDRGLPQAPVAEKKEVKSPEGHEQLPVPRKPVIPGKPAAKKVEVDENFNPDDLFRDAKKPVIGKKKGLLGPGAARKEERGVKRNLVRNVVIAGIALSSVLVIVYLWFFADFGFRKETVTPPKGTVSPQQEKSAAPQRDGQRTIVATVPSPPQQLPQPPADSPSDVPATSSGKPTSEKSAPVRALPPQKPALSAPEKSGPASPADKKPAPALAPGYYIQVGYFSVEENAESLYNDLKSKNYSAFIKKDRTKNGIRYRVLVGRYKNKDDAAKALKKISGAEKIRGAIYRL
ncbi:MAG: SPOR domain-containing protein, partial [bacterium]